MRGSALLMATVTQEGREEREKPESFEEKKLEGKKGRRWMDGRTDHGGMRGKHAAGLAGKGRDRERRPMLRTCTELHRH